MITAAIRYLALCVSAGVALRGAMDAGGDLVAELRRDRRRAVYVRCPKCSSNIPVRDGDTLRCWVCPTELEAEDARSSADIDKPASSAPA